MALVNKTTNMSLNTSADVLIADVLICRCFCSMCCCLVCLCLYR